jgi:hypothetical protein
LFLQNILQATNSNDLEELVLSCVFDSHIN